MGNRSRNLKWRAATVLLAAAGCMSSQLLAFSDGWQPWEAYEGISGVGSITKVSPANTSWLHWSKNGVGESASFRITYNEPKDNDKRVCYKDDVIVDQEITDFYPSEDDENWVASAGSISQSGEFTPDAAVNDAVTVECFIGDGSSGYAGEEVHREWGAHLTVFRVGVEVQPANVTIWEDDPTADHSWTVYANGTALDALKETTPWDSAGAYPASATGWSHSCAWTSRTEPGGGGQIIQGRISFNPNITATGMLRFAAKGFPGYYYSSPGTGSAVANVCAAAGVAATSGSNPYVAAGAVILIGLSSGGSSVSCGFAADSAIEFVADKSNTFKIDNRQMDITEWEVLNQVIISSGLNCSGTASLKGDETRRGSAKASVEVGVNDDSLYQWHSVQAQAGTNPTLKYGTSSPSYGQ